MKLKFVKLLLEQKVFGARPMVSILPDRDSVELTMVGDWVHCRATRGEHEGQVLMIHGSRTEHVVPAEDPLAGKPRGK
jgi:hypothetical protein